MSACVVCNLCDRPGTLARAREIARVPCHVRRFRDRTFTVWRCDHCESLHSAEAMNLDEFYEHFPLKRHRLDYATRIGCANRLEFLTRHGFRSGQRLLDYGCGSGVFLQFLREQGFRNVAGYDPFVPEFADRRVLDRQFDVVTAYDVIEHADRPDQTLAAIVASVKGNGLVALGTPNASRLALPRVAPFPIELSQPYHRHVLSEHALFRLAGAHGLATLEVSHRFPFDSLYPFVNTRFMWTYIEATGGMIDAAVEPIDLARVLRSPRLLGHALFGYFAPPPGNILVTFRKTDAPEAGGEDATVHSPRSGEFASENPMTM